MECQEKIHVPVFTDINKDIFLQDIYPQVRRIPAALDFFWRNMCVNMCLHIAVHVVFPALSSGICVVRFNVFRQNDSINQMHNVIYYICKILLCLWCKTQHYLEVLKDIAGWEWRYRVIFLPPAQTSRAERG